MSGRTKRILYYIMDWTLWAVSLAGVILLFLLSAPMRGAGEYIALSAVVLCVFLRVPAAFHECGHLLFGAAAGLKFHSVLLSYFLFTEGKPPRFIAKSEFGGASVMTPRSGEGVRARMIAFTVGGAVSNLTAGGIMFALYFALPYHAGLLFLALLAPLFLYEGLRALIPAELPGGKTDGMLLLGFIKKSRDETVALNVLTAQGILYRGEFSDVPEELLFDVPAVREDLPAFSALLLLRVQYLLSKGEETAAREQLDRLKAVEDLPPEVSEEAERYEGYFLGEFLPAAQKLSGVAKLEEELCARKNKKSAHQAENFK